MKRFRPIDYQESATEERFLHAKNIADNLTLSELVNLSEDYNVGYDIPAGFFEVSLLIPITRIEERK